jgi:hypothetical protein
VIRKLQKKKFRWCENTQRIKKERLRHNILAQEEEKEERGEKYKCRTYSKFIICSIGGKASLQRKLETANV